MTVEILEKTIEVRHCIVKRLLSSKSAFALRDISRCTMDYNWKLKIKYCAFESEEQRDRAYKIWVRLFLEAEAKKGEMRQKGRKNKALQKLNRGFLQKKEHVKALPCNGPN